MPTLRQNRVITTDQTSGAVARKAVKPSTIGGVQRGAEATRAANAGSSRRAGPGATKERGEKFTGKQLKSAVADWLKSVRVAQGALDEGLKALELADEAGNDPIATMVEQACQLLVARLTDLMAQGAELADMAKDETSNNPTPGVSEFHNRSAGTPEEDCPANQTGMDSAAMDAGAQAVRAYAQDVSVTHVATVDAATLLLAERAEWKKVALLAAITDGDDIAAHRIRFGLAYPMSTDPIGDFMKRHSPSPTSDGVVADYLKDKSN